MMCACQRIPRSNVSSNTMRTLFTSDFFNNFLKNSNGHWCSHWVGMIQVTLDLLLAFSGPPGQRLPRNAPGATKDMGKMLGGEEEKDPDAAKKEEERQEALRQQEEERKAKYAKMEAERENVRQGIRDKVGCYVGLIPTSLHGA
uniref:Uncharacterized protein n=1 Tax=Sphaerodactylus townsendi TaxID=933632 RepID=A0ACB8ES90_9SAUR